MRFPLFLCLTFGLASSLVDFTNSALYDIYDFNKGDEVHLTKCDYGCLIFAATQGEGFVQYPEGLDPYAMNLIITDNDRGNTISISKLAQQRDSKQRKTPLTITGRGNISVVNQNDPAEKVWWTVLLYVIEKTKAEEFTSYEVYDAYYTNGKKFTPQADIVTFMSGWMFRVIADANTQSNSVTARLTGFDNALDNNKDGCPYAYKTPAGASFPGFTINSLPQMISFVIEKRNPIQFSVDFQYSSILDLAIDGFITSPGWNGCKKPNNGGFQTIRTRDDLSTDSYNLYSKENAFNVSLEVLPNMDGNHKLKISEPGGITTIVTGTIERDLEYPNTRDLFVNFENMKGDQGFLMRYYSTNSTQTTTRPITVASTSPIPSTRVTSSGITTTVPRTFPSTTSGTKLSDNYCNCGFMDGWFDDWDPSEIWVDLVIILDTSMSMGDSLEEAKSVLTSFIALMSTDTTAEFYSRIGVIAASDTIEVVYNLNMSSTDSLDVIKQHKVDKIDVGAAFQAALTMFADGSKCAPYRENAKQIVYYLTNSAPGANMNGVDDFKTSGGIIIVNDFILEGDVADPSLKKLASDNYFFSDLSENYLSNLAVLSNCFCSPSKHAFNDDDISPRTQANRGCFHPVNNGIPQAKARDTCEKEDASLVSIHNQEKEFFVNGVVSVFGPKKKYWLGLQNDGRAWNWDDNSTDPFSDWDVNQPDTNGGKLQCAYATQTTGLNVRWTAANCAMGGVIYVCESVPCSRGNNKC